MITIKRINKSPLFPTVPHAARHDNNASAVLGGGIRGRVPFRVRRIMHWPFLGVVFGDGYHSAFGPRASTVVLGGGIRENKRIPFRARRSRSHRRSWGWYSITGTIPRSASHAVAVLGGGSRGRLPFRVRHSRIICSCTLAFRYMHTTPFYLRSHRSLLLAQTSCNMSQVWICSVCRSVIWPGEYQVWQCIGVGRT